MPQKGAILNLMQSVARAQSPQEIYASALQCLREALHVERASMLLCDAQGVMRFVAWTGLSDAYRAAVDGHSPWSTDAADAAPLPVPDVLSDATLQGLAPVFAAEGIRALAFVPLRFGTRLLGKFMLYYAEPHEFSPDELMLAEIVAAHVAFALEHLRIATELEGRVEAERRLGRDRAARLTESEHARRGAEEACQQLQTVAEATADIATSLDPDDVLRRLAARAVEKLADYCVTYAYEPGSEIRRLGLAHRLPHKAPLVERLEEVGPATPDSPVGEAIRTGRAALFEEITSEWLEGSAQNAVHLAALRALAPLSALLVPLEARGRTVGAIVLAATEDSGRRYGPADLEVATALASRAALLVDNARLYAEARAAIDARDQMIAVVSHDLRNPLQTVVTAATLLRRDGSPERRARSLESIALATSQMTGLLQDLLDISRMDAGEFIVSLDSVPVAALIDEAHTLFLPIAEGKSIRLESVADVTVGAVRADRARVLQVLSNLLGNALKFTPEGGSVRIEAARRGQVVRFAVVDTGPGIRREQHGKVFQRFWRANPERRLGAGLGLAVAKGIVAAHGGDLCVDSVEGCGSTFYFELRSAGEPLRIGEPAGELSVEARY